MISANDTEAQKVNIIIKNSQRPMEEYRVDQVLNLNSTVKDLRAHLEANYPHREHVQDRFKLIFAGTFLNDDNQSLKSVFGKHDAVNSSQTVHMLVQTGKLHANNIATPTSATPASSASNNLANAVFSNANIQRHLSEQQATASSSSAASPLPSQTPTSATGFGNMTPMSQDQQRQFLSWVQQQQQKFAAIRQQQQQRNQQLLGNAGAATNLQQQQQAQQQQQIPSIQAPPAEEPAAAVNNPEQPQQQQQDIWGFIVSKIIRIGMFAFLLTANGGARKWLQTTLLLLVFYAIYYVIFGGTRRRQQPQQDENAANNNSGASGETQEQQRPQGFFAIATRMIYLFFASMNPSWRPSNWQNFVIPGEDDDADE